MKHYIVYYGQLWDFRKSVSVLCKEEDIQTIATAIFHGNVRDKGFCLVEDEEDGACIQIADCM